MYHIGKFNMSTKKPLKELIPDIIEHFQLNQSYLQFNQKLYKLYQGQIKQEIENSLREELISTAAYNRAIKRIPSINVINKTVQKLSKVYAKQPTRLTDNKTDREIMDNIIKLSDLDHTMHTANEMLNLHKGCLIEPYISDNGIRFRVLAFHQFLPFPFL